MGIGPVPAVEGSSGRESTLDLDLVELNEGVRVKPRRHP
jgi:hypothetical protein